MSRFHFARPGPEHDLTAFDCGFVAHNDWLVRYATGAEAAGNARVFLLLERNGGADRVRGYFAICPTAVVRDFPPASLGRGSPEPVPAYLIAKLALDRSLRGDQVNQWGTQLLVEALRRIVAASESGGGRLIVVDAGSPQLVDWYRAHSFQPTGKDPRRLHMKVATARAGIERYDSGA